MTCSEKQDLQNKCTAAWNAYAAVVNESGLYRAAELGYEAIDRGSGTVAPPSISGLVALRFGSASYSAALRLRGDHLKASRELSRHLSRHRC